MKYLLILLTIVFISCNKYYTIVSVKKSQSYKNEYIAKHKNDSIVFSTLLKVYNPGECVKKKEIKKYIKN